MRTALALASVLAVTTIATPAADACSPPPCWPGAFLPVDGATVPANVPGFVWRPMVDYQNQATDPTKVELVATDGSGAIAIETRGLDDGTFILTPAPAALVPGKTYKLVDHTQCTQSPGSFETPAASFTVSGAVPFPITLGTTTVAANGVRPMSIGTSSGSCTTEADADSADVALVLSANAAPWRDVLSYSTTLDGGPWRGAGPINTTEPPGQSWVGRASDNVYHVCSSTDQGIATGTTFGDHAVAIHAFLPGTALDFATATTPFSLSSCTYPPYIPGDDTPVLTDDVGSGGCSTTGGSGSLMMLGIAGAIAVRRRRVTR